ncbi:hypothetical protein OPV22_007174 [Ensete ventricosum]|uniref:Uncharacterized protein n=1 Tax=Ensete ventricosum TaxID=4639 RepID=A0AAV8RR74_ENSVE|nr:hypothetical protein OPV22_007174 [Ensete ventricosum]
MVAQGFDGNCKQAADPAVKSCKGPDQSIKRSSGPLSEFDGRVKQEKRKMTRKLIDSHPVNLTCERATRSDACMAGSMKVKHRRYLREPTRHETCYRHHHHLHGVPTATAGSFAGLFMALTCFLTEQDTKHDTDGVKDGPKETS